MLHPTQIFNRHLLKMRRNAVAKTQPQPDDFLKREMCEWLAQRLDEMTRHFPLALDLGCHGGQMQQVLAGRGGIHRLVQCDLSPAMLRHAVGEKLVVDEEWLPFAPQSFDLVLSAGSLHWVNDLPGCLAQIRRILKPNGLFMAVLAGARSLQELRESFAAVEAEKGVIRPHVAPFVEVRDAGNLLARVGFDAPVADSELLTLTYAHPLALLRELKAMGENNMLQEQEKGLASGALMAQMCDYYQQHYAAEGGRVYASLEWVTITGLASA